MSEGADRRAVLAGLAVLGVTGCVERTAAFHPAESDLILVEPIDLSGLEARHGGRIGLHAEYAGASAEWRAEDAFTYCSTFKLFLAAATLDRVIAAQERLDRSVPVRRADIVPHAPITGMVVGSALTIGELLKATVEVSDNPAANILIRELGGLDALRGWYRSIGDQVTRVDRLEPELNAFAPGDLRDTTTPKQATANLMQVFEGYTFGRAHRPLRQAERDLLLKWLFDSPTGAGRIKAGVPAGYRVAHKTGTSSDGPTNDVGLIYPPTGAPIRIAVYYHATDVSAPEQRDAVVAEATRIALTAIFTSLRLPPQYT